VTKGGVEGVAVRGGSHCHHPLLLLLSSLLPSPSQRWYSERNEKYEELAGFLRKWIQEYGCNESTFFHVMCV